MKERIKCGQEDTPTCSRLFFLFLKGNVNESLIKKSSHPIASLNHKSTHDNEYVVKTNEMDK